ncbi:hypothetical protein L204_104094 [Cryptococcus depauperatus]|nr:compass component bre2 [Cryptococcus depauperatus CBS 7855]
MSNPIKTSLPNVSSPSPWDSSPASTNLPLPNISFSSEGQGLAGPESSTASIQKVVREDVEKREFARMGVAVAGSGDGLGVGEECFQWIDVPSVKNFRYTPCALSDTPSPHPSFPFYRTIPYPPPIPPVHLSLLDRSAFLRMSPSLLTVYNEKGFRSCRTNVSIREGAWYYEVRVEHGDGDRGEGRGSAGEGGNPHVRLGWGRREANLDTPVGCDAYSYAIRDVNGEKVHLSRPKSYAGMPFKTGDVVGCLISLPPRPSPDNFPKNHPARIKRQRRPFNYKGQAYFESAEYSSCKEMDVLIDRDGKLAAELATQSGQDLSNEGPKGVRKGATTKNTKKGRKQPNKPPDSIDRTLGKLPGSFVSFTINGRYFGSAFEDLYDFTPLPSIPGSAHGSSKKHTNGDVQHDDGTLGYYPMISCFGRAKATCNFGPSFAYPSPVGARPMYERWEEFRKEERRQDEFDEIEDSKKLQAILDTEKKMPPKVKLKPSNTTSKKFSKRKRDVRDGTDYSTPGPDNRGLTTTPAPEAPLTDFDAKPERDEWENPRDRSESVSSTYLFNMWGLANAEKVIDQNESDQAHEQDGTEHREEGEDIERTPDKPSATLYHDADTREHQNEEMKSEGSLEGIQW